MRFRHRAGTKGDNFSSCASLQVCGMTSFKLAADLSRHLSIAWLSLIVAGTLLVPPLAYGQPQQRDSIAESSNPAGVVDPESVEIWADDVFKGLLKEYRISAGAIAVTQGERVVLTKGYGYSDWAAKTPVDAETSQFRIGSLTKTFLATAIAQLLEKGDIESLDDSVNRYLTRFQIPDFAGTEVTIWDLLTHQGGFGRASVFVPESGEPRPVPPLSAEVIEAGMPDIVRQPGTISIYCNPCSATLGFMVEDITGVTLEDYLREHVYAPLAMEHTTLTNAAVPDPHVVTQYEFLPGQPPVELPYPAISPYISYAGDINSTAGDMAKWLISNIQRGAGNSPALMSRDTYEVLQSRKRGNHPTTSGFGMHFFTYDYNGERVLEHYGSIRYRSLQLMMLDSKIGVFITVAGGGMSTDGTRSSGETAMKPIDSSATVENALSHSGMRALILEHFLGRLRPMSMLEHQPDLGDITGEYFSIPADQSADPEGPGVIVEAAPGGGLIIGGIGPYRASGSNTFTLDGELPLEAGFRESNRYTFVVSSNQPTRMFAHVNAGGFQRSTD